MSRANRELDAYFKNDAYFLSLFPTEIASFNKNHFTPIEVALKAASFLASERNKSVLDIGSGIGKFCLTAAYHFPETTFYGVEQRSDLHEAALQANEIFKLKNVNFIHGNMDQLNFEMYDHFYFFNSFHEQLDDAAKMNDTIDHDENLYHYYNRYFFKQLLQKPAGTKLVAFFTLDEEIPENYLLAESHFDQTLQCYIKI